jgi:ribosomal protein L14
MKDNLNVLPWKKKETRCSRGCTIKTRLRCIDDTADILEIIGFKKLSGVAKRNVSGGVGSIAKVAIKKGKEKGKMAFALITTTKSCFFRKDKGIHVSFEENTAVIVEQVKSFYQVKSSKIKGIIAKECLKVIPKLNTMAKIC